MKPVLTRRSTPSDSVLLVRSGTPRDGDSLVREHRQTQLPPQTYALGYLCTGTALAILGQVVTNQGAVDPSTQLIAWTKYSCTFVLSLALQLLSRARGGGSGGAAAAGGVPGGAPGSASSGRKALWLTVAIGLLDTLSYGLNCLGFARCGSSLSMVVFAACGQVFTAVARRLLLRKGMTAGQALGVSLVALGLVVRGAGHLRLGSLPAAAAAADRGLAAGVGFVALSALGYSVLGCLYEWLSAVRGASMSHAEVATATSAIGLVATTAFQAAFTAPRWQALVADRMAERGLAWGPVLRLYALFGALFTVHGLVQGVVLQRSGATAVGIVSALRASAVAVASGALFCRPGAPQQCLTPASAASAAVVTVGAMLWTLTGPRKPMPAAAGQRAPWEEEGATSEGGTQGRSKYGKLH